MTETSKPAPPRPSTPSSPQPSRPPGRGHLPIDPCAAASTARERVPVGAGVDPNRRFRSSDIASMIGLPVRLGEIIRDAEHQLAQVLSTLSRDYDAASAPSAEDDPAGLAYVEVRLMSAKADARSALTMLRQISDTALPPAGSAVQFSARRDPTVATTGGPFNPTTRPSPGRDARCAPVAGVGSPGGFAASGAGRHEPDRPTAPGPKPKPGAWPSAEQMVDIQTRINEALARRSR